MSDAKTTKSIRTGKIGSCLEGRYHGMEEAYAVSRVLSFGYDLRMKERVLSE